MANDRPVHVPVGPARPLHPIATSREKAALFAEGLRGAAESARHRGTSVALDPEEAERLADVLDRLAKRQCPC